MRCYFLCICRYLLLTGVFWLAGYAARWVAATWSWTAAANRARSRAPPPCHRCEGWAAVALRLPPLTLSSLTLVRRHPLSWSLFTSHIVSAKIVWEKKKLAINLVMKYLSKIFFPFVFGCLDVNGHKQHPSVNARDSHKVSSPNSMEVFEMSSC